MVPKPGCASESSKGNFKYIERFPATPPSVLLDNLILDGVYG